MAQETSSSGKIRSNAEPEKEIDGLFDYGDITERDKSVVNEIIEFIRTRPGVPGEMLIEELKLKFQIVEIPMMKMEGTVWHALTKDERIGQSVQGFRQTTDKEGKQIRIPHIGFSADLDYLEEMVQRLATKIIAVTSNKEQEKKDK